MKTNDFVGADMARKYLQMGYTRVRRYANYKGGKIYNADNDYELLERGTGDPEKATAAQIFYEKWNLLSSMSIMLCKKNSGNVKRVKKKICLKSSV